jgi:hypothetical protein
MAENRFRSIWDLNGRARDAQPAWSLQLARFVGIPALGIFGIVGLLGKANELRPIFLGAFEIFAVCALIWNFFVFRSIFRGDL